MKELKVNCTIKGGMCRPSYDGYVKVYVEDISSVHEAVFWKLKRSSFPEIRRDDLVVRNIEL